MDHDEAVEQTLKNLKKHGKPSDNPAYGKLVSRVAKLEELVMEIATFVEFPVPPPADEEPPEEVT